LLEKKGLTKKTYSEGLFCKKLIVATPQTLS